MFQIDLKINNNNKVTLSSYNDYTTSLYQHTFDETFTVEINDLMKLDFSMIFKDNNQINLFTQQIHFGSEIILTTDTRVIPFIVTNVSVEINQSLIIYHFSCQDRFSYKMSHLKLGYSYSSNIPETIFTIGSKILGDATEEWRCKLLDLYRDTTKLKDQYITFTIDNSTPYNALVELAAQQNAYLIVNYEQQVISFKAQTDGKVVGIYQPNIDLQSFSIDSSGDNMTTMLHATGGENEYGEITTIIPPMPQCLINFFNTKDSKGKTELAKFKDYIDRHRLQDAFTFFNNKTDIATTDQEKLEYKNFINMGLVHPLLTQFLLDFSYFDHTIDISNSETFQNWGKKILKANLDLYKTIPEYYTYFNNVNDILGQAAGFIDGYFAQIPATPKLISDWQDGEGIFNWKNVIHSKMELSEIENQIKLYLKPYVSNVLKTDDLDKLNSLLQEANSKVNLAGLLGTVNIENQQYVLQNIEQLSCFHDKKYNQKIYQDKVSELAVIKQKIRAYLDNSGTIADQYYISLHSTELQLEKEILLSLRYQDKFSIESDVNSSKAISGMYSIYSTQLHQIVLPYECAGILSGYTICQSEVNKVINQLYDLFSFFIYEQYYENENEFDSISLFNQTANFLQTTNKPSGSYNATIINLNNIIQYGSIENLHIGDYVQIKIPNYPEMSQLRYDNNQLTITGFTKELRHDGDIALSLEQTSKYQDIFNKILTSLQRQKL